MTKPIATTSAAPEIQAAGLYQAMLTRDARFDGVFFVGVSSTGIYCRPVCKVKTPKPQNCQFFAHAAAAEAAGYRPCLKCRPETAPGFSRFRLKDQWAVCAADWIDAKVFDTNATGKWSFASIAKKIGITDRHLRRTFQEHWGATPVQYAQTQKLLMAKRLLAETDMPIVDVAAASGFHSTKRMYTLFAERYRLAPARMRGQTRNVDVATQPSSSAKRGRAQDQPSSSAKRGRAQDETDQLRLTLRYRGQFDFGQMLAFFQARAIPGVENIAARCYQRVWRGHAANGQTLLGALCVRELRHSSITSAEPALELTVSRNLAPVIGKVLADVKRVFDLAADADEIRQQLGDLVQPGAPSLRLPGAFDGFELAVRAILGQQITVAAARTLATRLVQRWGLPVSFGSEYPELHVAFPSASTVAAISPSDLGEMGIIRARAAAIIELAKRVETGELDLCATAKMPTLCAQLVAVPGIGPWTAHYIAMRALSWPDAWPPRDVAILKALGLPNTAQGQREADQRAEAWRPWRSYAVLYAWQSLSMAKG